MASSLTSWAFNAVLATVMEFLVIGGIFLLFGSLLYWLEKRSFSVLSTAFGFNSVVYTTGWIGTTAHELGHAVMCVIFGHRITEISLFRPDLETGVMGYVHHSYNPNNLYHQTGRLFIGIAPLLTGGALLFGLIFVFFPDYSVSVLKPGHNYGVADFLKAIGVPVWETMKVIFEPHGLITWKFWVFIYIAICVSSHLAPSSKDMEGFWKGLVILFLLLLPVNGAVVASGWMVGGDIIELFQYVGAGAGFLAVALSLSVLSFIVSFAVSAVWYWVRSGKLLSPV